MAAEAFEFDGTAVSPGATVNERFTVSETYLGDPVRIPVTVVNGSDPGEWVLLSAAAHGDELNGIEVVREAANAADPDEIAGGLVCLPVLNVPGFLAQQRYLPVYDRDLNRSFPGNPTGTGAKRIAHRVFEAFVEPCDVALDFHTSTRGRSNMLHVRGDCSDDRVSRLAQAFGTTVIIDKPGPSGSLRRAATEAGVPTIAIEFGEAHRFQRELIDDALAGVDSVLAEFGCHEQEAVRWPGWRTIVDEAHDRAWLRAEDGGLVEVHADRGSLVEEGEVVCTITNPFKTTTSEVRAPFTGILLGVLENPVVYPGNPVCHLIEPSAPARGILEE
jgi:predicted deacylase